MKEVDFDLGWNSNTSIDNIRDRSYKIPGECEKCDERCEEIVEMVDGSGGGGDV